MPHPCVLPKFLLLFFHICHVFHVCDLVPFKSCANWDFIVVSLSKGFKYWCVIFFLWPSLLFLEMPTKHQHKYLLVFAFLNKCRTMIDNVANKVDYGQLLKLKTDMFENLNKDLKEPKVKKKSIIQLKHKQNY